MSAVVLRTPERKARYEYRLTFHFRGNPNAGFGFPCDADGNLRWRDMPNAARINYRKCVEREHNVFGPHVEALRSEYVEPGEMRCPCGTVHPFLFGEDVACDCGLSFNSAGQEIRVTGFGWTDAELESREYREEF